MFLMKIDVEPFVRKSRMVLPFIPDTRIGRVKTIRREDFIISKRMYIIKYFNMSIIFYVPFAINGQVKYTIIN